MPIQTLRLIIPFFALTTSPISNVTSSGTIFSSLVSSLLLFLHFSIRPPGWLIASLTLESSILMDQMFRDVCMRVYYASWRGVLVPAIFLLHLFWRWNMIQDAGYHLCLDILVFIPYFWLLILCVDLKCVLLSILAMFRMWFSLLKTAYLSWCNLIQYVPTSLEFVPRLPRKV